MTDPAQHGWRGLALLRRLAVRMLRIGQTRRLALPPPQAPSPAAPEEAPAVIVLPADSEAIGEPPKPEPAAPPPWRPPDPARRAKYFAAPYVTPSPPILRLARPTPASAEATLPTSAAPEALPLAGLATASGAPTGAAPGMIDCIEPIRFSAFAIWHPEAAMEVPPDATAAWLLEPVLLARAVRLRDAVLHNYAAGGAPLHPAALFEASMRIAGHVATALLLCLTVTRTFARGAEAPLATGCRLIYRCRAIPMGWLSLVTPIGPVCSTCCLPRRRSARPTAATGTASSRSRPWRRPPPLLVALRRGH
jgi:hypothetical protein